MFLPKSKPVVGAALSRERCFEGINFASDDNFTDDLLAVNHRFLAAALEEECGSFVVVQIERTGKTDGELPKICAHREKITSLKWNPYDPHQVSSASEDGLIKLWKIGDGGVVKDTSVCQSLLSGHKGAVSKLEWHPFASGVLLSVGLDMKCLVWNVRLESTFMEITLPGHGVMTSVSWSPEGSAFAVLWKDQSLAVVEPRTGSFLLKAKLEDQSIESRKVMFVEDKKMLIVGSSPSSITLRLWHAEEGRLKLLKTVNTENISKDGDISLSSFLDHQQQTLFISQKDGGCLRMFKLSADDIVAINEHPISKYRGMAMMSAGGLDTARNEIARIYKINSTKNICEVLSLTGSRGKAGETGKHHAPQYSADQWFQGHPAPQIISQQTVTVKKPEIPAKQTTSPSSSSSSLTPQTSSSSLSPPSVQSMIPSSSSSFIHLTFSSPKLNRKSTKVSTDTGSFTLKSQGQIPRRNSVIGQQHYLYSPTPALSSSGTSSHHQVGCQRTGLIQNAAYKGGGDRRASVSGPPCLISFESGNHSMPLPRLRSHKSPSCSAVRLRRMKQKELMFQTSSSSSSAEDLDAKQERWNENPLYSKTTHKSRKHPSKLKSKGHLESQQKHSINLINTRSSTIDFGPLDDALNEVLNQNKSLSQSSYDLTDVSRRNNPHRFHNFQPLTEATNTHIPTLGRNKKIPLRSEFDKNLGESFHRNPILNGYPDAGHYRSAFSVVRPLKISPNPDQNTRLFNGVDILKAIPYIGYKSSCNLPHSVNLNSLLRPTSVSLKETPRDRHKVAMDKSAPMAANLLSNIKTQNVNHGTPHLMATQSVERLYPLHCLQSSLQTITEDDHRFQTLNGCYSSSSSISSQSDRTLHSDNSTINYELNENYQCLSPDPESPLSGPDEISNSFTFKVPLMRSLKNGISRSSSDKMDIFERCSIKEEEIEDLRKELSVKDVKIKILEEQLKTLKACPDN